MIMQIFKTIILNVSLLVLLAYLLARLRMVKAFITADYQPLTVRLAMAVIFGLIGILSAYPGIQVEGAIANTRVIRVIVGGILSGPAVGLGAGLFFKKSGWPRSSDTYSPTALLEPIPSGWAAFPLCLPFYAGRSIMVEKTERKSLG